MAGYNYSAGMSNNAVAAYGAGVKPISQITRDDLDDVGLKNVQIGLARWLARTKQWVPCEWHHSGGTWYNRVDFYDPADLAFAVQNGGIDLSAARAAWRAAAQNKNLEGQRVEGRYSVFGGSRRRPEYLGDEEFTGLLVGSWIHLDGGGKKKATGGHIKWTRC